MKELMFSAHNFMHVIQTLGNVAGKVQKKCSKDQYTILPTKGKFKSLPRPAPPVSRLWFFTMEVMLSCLIIFEQEATFPQ